MSVCISSEISVVAIVELLFAVCKLCIRSFQDVATRTIMPILFDS